MPFPEHLVSPAPGRLTFRIRALSMLVALVVSVGGITAYAAQHALLIGVGQYQAFAGQPQGNLEGPPNDVVALKNALQQLWGFREAEITTLIDRQATHAAIQAALDALVARARAGDEVFLYYSGHGVSARTRDAAALNLPYGSGAFTPFDWAGASATPEKQAATLLVGRRDLRPRLEKLDAAGVRVFVVADACYSGQSVRALAQPILRSDELTDKVLPLANQELIHDIAAVIATGGAAEPAVVERYPYRNVVYLSAASEGEVARDIPAHALSVFPTIDGKPHGAMTDALLRVLQGQLGADFDSNGQVSMREISRAVADFMAARALSHAPQLLPPVAEDDASISSRSVFGSGAPGQKSVVKVPVAAPPLLRIFVPSTEAPVVAAVRGVAGVELVASPTSPHDFSVQTDSGRWYVLSAGGDAISASDNLAGALATLRQLSGAQRLRSAAEHARRGVLAFEVNPGHYGGNFKVAQKINFVLRPDADAHLLLVSVDASGEWTTLFNSLDYGIRPLAGKQAHYAPGNSPQQMITVAEPLGTDVVFAFAFDATPPFLSGLRGMMRAKAEDRPMRDFLAGLAPMKGKFTFGRVELRTLPR